MPLQKNSNDPNHTNSQISPDVQHCPYKYPPPTSGPLPKLTSTLAAITTEATISALRFPLADLPFTPPKLLDNPYTTATPLLLPNHKCNTAPPQPQPLQQNLVFLGMLNEHWQSTSKPMYGPPGSTFDSNGNIYSPFARGHYHEYLVPYRCANGKIGKSPVQRREEDCCWTIFRDDGA